ncbi:MAG: 1-deoxy-D-xylulose-5-phosphate reductoisomerase [Alicyclobacillaceae bacterium]|nr:1-deoxy-D-xylulose-5-phosphate reductoisomerase [Alicyclobacillaceae bacterium]
MIDVTILGSTGVIGRHALEVISRHPEAYRVVALAAGRNAATLAEQIRAFRPQYVSVADEKAWAALRERLSGWSPLPDIGIGDDGLVEAARHPSDVVVNGVVGARGVRPTWAAVERGATVALANKETLVAAGDLIMALAATRGARLIPVDSEHSALFQCLLCGRPEEVERYILTASGGPFRTWSLDQLRHVTVEAALRHPNWRMGAKITVDSATLMNKGLEVIEAHHLFAAPYDRIEVLVHPQSVVHSMVEFRDGAVMAQLGAPDMRVPIQYALTYPERAASTWARLDLVRMRELTFEPPDLERFPSLALAYAAGRAGGILPCVLNAANEVAVDGFLRQRLSFLGIPRLVESVMEQCTAGPPKTLDDVLAADLWARRTASAMLEKGGWSD